MKQIVIRILGPQIPVYDFAYGEISEGQFFALDVNELPVEVLSIVHVSGLLGTQAYIESSNLSHLFKVLMDFASEVSFYPNFIVISLADYEKSQKTEETA